MELDLRDSGLTFSWPCSRVRAALGEVGGKAGAPTPCSPDELAAFAKLLEGQEIPEAKIWLSAGLSAFLFLYTAILGLFFFSSVQMNLAALTSAPTLYLTDAVGYVLVQLQAWEGGGDLGPAHWRGPWLVRSVLRVHVRCSIDGCWRSWCCRRQQC